MYANIQPSSDRCNLSDRKFGEIAYARATVRFNAGGIGKALI